MNARLLTICCINILFLASCHFNEDIKKIAENNPQKPYNYNSRKIYVFAVKTSDSANNKLENDTLGLMCSNIIDKRMSGQSEISWAYLSSSENGFELNKNKITNNYTGILSKDTELFLHPPRESQYIWLETCPFPYLFFPLFIGKKWSWNLDVGSQYCPDENITWTKDELFKSTYEVVGTVITDVPAGKIFCYHIHANCTATVGSSSADFFYSYELGLVKLSYSTLNKTKIELNLVTICNCEPLLKLIFFGFKDENETWLSHQQAYEKL